MKTGIELIAKERQDQIEKHGFSVESDKKYQKRELSRIAEMLMPFDKNDINYNKYPNNFPVFLFKKLYEKSYKERLITAGALIAAEIDRLQSEDNLPSHE